VRSERPVAAFAGILDGRRLWLAIEDAPGSLALRAAGSGDVIALANEVPAEDQPGYRAARFDLSGLPDADESTYEVVLVRGRHRTPRPVQSGPVEPCRPGAGWRLDRADDGVLRLHREPAPDAAELRTVEVTDAGLRLTIAGTGSSLALLGDDEQPLVSLPARAEDGTVTAVLDAASLPEVTVELGTRVVVGEPGAWLSVRRRANDLADPGRGAPLPALADADERERLRLRWSPRALLRAVLVGPGAPG
jgi:hypothetical protein